MSIETSLSKFSLSRRSQRILVRVPVSVSGEMSDNAPFQESTYTIAISSDGALLPLSRVYRKGQHLKLLNIKTGQEEDCAVAFVEPSELEYTQVRVQFFEPHPMFWHIMFPPSDWTRHHSDSKFRKTTQ